MKKLTTILLSAALLISTSSFAGKGEEISEAIKTAFAKSFSSAKNVNWKKTNDLYFANFQVERSKLFAAFNESGDLVAVSRTIDISQVPLALARAIQKDYADYYLSGSVTEMVLEGNTSYYFNAESKTRSLELKGNANGEISVEKKTKK
ncbi:MAG TPA: hypothetical protein VK498_11850 [Ferruginibacter sp.]|nr:hypothetical protein [Ferruginibacter sp.]